MKMFEIGRCDKQINKLRDALEASPTIPAGKIKRPTGMRELIYQSKLARLKAKEEEKKDLMRQGLRKWEKSRYYVK